MHKDNSTVERVTTAVLLAAGMGSRLQPLTETVPKCLTLVNGVSILERLTDSLRRYGVKRLIVVTGHVESHVRMSLAQQAGERRIRMIGSE